MRCVSGARQMLIVGGIKRGSRGGLRGILPVCFLSLSFSTHSLKRSDEKKKEEGLDKTNENECTDSWSRIVEIANENSFYMEYADFWGHPDPDMLEVGNGDLTLEENRAHFALWAAMKSPLIIGTSVRFSILFLPSFLSPPSRSAVLQEISKVSN